jgi:hypothetical protein
MIRFHQGESTNISMIPPVSLRHMIADLPTTQTHYNGNPYCACAVFVPLVNYIVTVAKLMSIAREKTSFCFLLVNPKTATVTIRFLKGQRNG